MIEVLPNRLKETLIAWFHKLTPWDRENIKIVSMDLLMPYRQAVAQALPQTEIVADRYHLTKNLNEVLEKARRALQKHLPKDVASKLKVLRWVLLKAQEDLDDSEKEKLQAVYELSPMLRRLHQLKERFRNIFERITDRKQAERFLEAWVCEVKQFGCDKLLEFVKTLEHWWEPILNYFNRRVTNGAVEGLNNRVKLIKRYRNVTNFRNRIVAEICGAGPLV